MTARQIVLDTETTGLNPAQNHRIIEIGCIELINRRLTGNNFHCYLQPDRSMEPEVVKVHGITEEFLKDKPRFADIAADFLGFVKGAQLIAHNAPFDIGFLDHELGKLAKSGQPVQRMADICGVLDTLRLAQKRHPGQKNTLDALCKRYNVDNSQRTLHGALLDASILADVYLAMTREQVALGLAETTTTEQMPQTEARRERSSTHPPLTVVRASAAEQETHARYLEMLEKSSGGCLWKTQT